MNILRSFSKGFAVFLLLIVLLAMPLFIALQAAVNSPQAVKASLSKSTIYEKLTEPDVLLNNSDLSSAALADEGVQAALRSAVMPSYVQASTERLIDGIYAYIRGEAVTLDLSVDVGDAKTRFADSMAQYVRQKFEALPRCQELKIPSTSIESLLEATCAPVGISSQQAASYARDEILHAALFSNDRLDVAGLVSVRETFLRAYVDEIRAMYPAFIMLVYVLPIAAFILIFCVLLLASSRRRGVKIIANVFMTAGIIGLLVGLVAIGLAAIILDVSQASNAAMGSLKIATADVLNGLRMWWLGVASLFVAISIILYITLGITKPSEAQSGMAKNRNSSV